MKNKLLLVLCILGISLLVTTNVFAKVDALVREDSQGNYYQYDLDSLNHDAVKNALNLPSALFDEYMQTEIVSFHDNKTGYIDPEYVLKEATLAVMACYTFTVDNCTENAKGSAIVTFMAPIQIRILDSSGNVINGNVINGAVINPSGEVTTVTFKDKGLEQAVRYAIKKPKRDIYKSDVEKITSLNNTFRINFIKDITGIESLTNLEELKLYDNQLSDINALKELTKLKYLSLINNQISDISALKGLPNLKYLDLSNNQLSDINALKELTNLQSLNLSRNKISDDDKQLLINALPKCSISF